MSRIGYILGPKGEISKQKREVSMIRKCHNRTVDSEVFARILFSRIALKDILALWKIRD